MVDGGGGGKGEGQRCWAGWSGVWGDGVAGGGATGWAVPGCHGRRPAAAGGAAAVRWAWPRWAARSCAEVIWRGGGAGGDRAGRCRPPWPSPPPTTTATVAEARGGRGTCARAGLRSAAGCAHLWAVGRPRSRALEYERRKRTDRHAGGTTLRGKLVGAGKEAAGGQPRVGTHADRWTSGPSGVKDAEAKKMETMVTRGSRRNKESSCLPL